MKIIIALLVFTVLIVFHELGHFLLAKKNGVFVKEFSVGMGLRLVTFARFCAAGEEKKRFHFRLLAKGEYLEEEEGFREHTKYSIKLFPLGGSCAMLGEMDALEDERSFNKKGVFARIAIVVAGPLFNFFLAFFFALIIVGSVGYDPARVLYVQPGMPFSESGIKEGDTITSINGTSIYFAREINAYMTFHPMDGSPMEIGYEHEGEERMAVVVPEKASDGAFRLGFSYNPAYREKTGVGGVIKSSVYEVKYWICLTVESLGKMISGDVKKEEIAGPVGVVNVIGDTYEETKSEGAWLVILNLLNISILLSANLGVMNLIPFPALDGGRLLFLIIEAIRRKPVPVEKEGMVHFIGFALLMLLMVFIMYNDISRIITGG